MDKLELLLKGSQQFWESLDLNNAKLNPQGFAALAEEGAAAITLETWAI